MNSVESRMRGNAHVRFGRRAGETDRPKGRHRVRSLDRDPLATQAMS
jgi:hypothetical protein